ncbi:recombinase family protein [Desulfomonile tiedjei]|uniref:Site-specific recombinase, DNA invertase Pin n=1 Tax=Desulfomonile tiedjei (strain ATCC 49306 / DSM 6799 / DCB-1) TaxID=706587 RepID=I4C5Z8_DESTA|nr:recombinase family protein [Desulfomonile tiedjei]AFM24989.1 site-specific recombinase, DNA invertase Pin [Desulfomonile tiedjei DSM 6799]
MKRAAIYTRVSTEDQAENGVSLENQSERIREYCSYKNLEIVVEIEDAGVSGGLNKSREGFMKLLDLAENGQIDCIVFYSLERLSRDMLTMLTLERLFEDHNVELHTVDGQVDTSTPDGFMQFAMKSFLGEMERRQIKYRTKKAMQHKKQNGHVTGAVCYGYTEKIVSINGREKPLRVLQLYEPEQEIIRSVNTMYQTGKRLSQIVCSLNSNGITTREGKGWTPQQVKRLIPGYENCFKKSKTRISVAARAFIEAIA